MQEQRVQRAPTGTRTLLTWAMTSEMEAHPTRKLYLCFKRMPAWVHACRGTESGMRDTFGTARFLAVAIYWAFLKRTFYGPIPTPAKP